MPVLFFILLSVILGATAQVLFKVGVQHLGHIVFNLQELSHLVFNPFILSGLAAFAFSFFLWIIVLAKVPLSYAYPMVSLGYVFVFLAARIFLGESLPPLRILGLALIITGILAIARS